MDSPSSSSSYRRALSRSRCAAYSRSSFAVCISFTLSLSVAAPDDPPARGGVGGLAALPVETLRMANVLTVPQVRGVDHLCAAAVLAADPALRVRADDGLHGGGHGVVRHLVHLNLSTLIVYESYTSVKRSGAGNPGVSQNRRAPSPFRNTVTTDIPRIAWRSVGHHGALRGIGHA